MAVLVVVTVLSVCAQEKKKEVESYLDFDLLSHYYWRGLDIGGVSLQPEAYVSWKGLTVKLEGSTGFERTDPSEIDVTLGYELYGFNIGVTDYWTTGVDKNNRYFHFEKRGAHRLEANLGYICKYFGLQAYTMFWGNDFKRSGKQAYSTYIELNVPFRLGEVDWNLSIGGTPFESAGHDEVLENQGEFGDETHYIRHYFYADKATCVQANLRATKTVNLGFAHVPVFAELNTNPYLQTAGFVCGLIITPF